MHDIHVIVHFETKPESIVPFTALMAQVQRDLPQVSGCRGVRVYSGSEHPHVFTLVEDWESQAAHQAHLTRVVSSGAWDTIAAHLAGEPVSRYVKALTPSALA